MDHQAVMIITLGGSEDVRACLSYMSVRAGGGKKRSHSDVVN